MNKRPIDKIYNDIDLFNSYFDNTINYNQSINNFKNIIINIDDKYVKNLSKNQTILMIMNRLLPIKYISIKIINMKNLLEIKETNDYYNKRYEKIAKEHYFLYKNHTGKFSYVLDSKSYIVKLDFKLDYYNYTGISYQIIGLIHELIKIKSEQFKNNEEYKEWLNYDDTLYKILSLKISEKMKQLYK